MREIYTQITELRSLIEEDFQEVAVLGGNAGRKVKRVKLGDNTYIAKTFPHKAESREIFVEVNALRTAYDLVANEGLEIVIPRPIAYVTDIANGKLTGFVTPDLGENVVDINSDSWMQVAPETKAILRQQYTDFVEICNAHGILIDGFDEGIRRNTSLFYRPDGKISLLAYDLSLASDPALAKPNNIKILNRLNFDLPLE